MSRFASERIEVEKGGCVKENDNKAMAGLVLNLMIRGMLSGFAVES